MSSLPVTLRLKRLTMNKELICYCGLYCGNCAVKVRIEPAAKVLHREMKNAGFESFIHYIPDGKPFWDFLTGMSETGTCTSCLTGGGNPGCTIRICAKEKNVELCALCESYPCGLFDPMVAIYPGLLADNELLRDKGLEEWGRLQMERQASAFTYPYEETE